MKTKLNEEYFNKLFALVKKSENLNALGKKARFNGTEMRLLSEVFRAKHEGKRLISTQLAKRLGITRSAISQIVNKMEQDGVVKRVPDDVDRKIAYVELTEATQITYQEEMKKHVQFINAVVEEFGVERFDGLCDLLNEFCLLIETRQEEILKKE